MNKIYFPLFLLTVFLFSCEADDDSTDIIECQEDNNKVTLSKLVKSDYKSNDVRNTYAYNDLDLILSRVRNAPGRVYEYDYVYDCRNNIVEVNVEETADPQYDGSSSFYEYDDQDRLISYHTSFQGEFNYNLSYEGNAVAVNGTIWSHPNTSISLQLNDQGLVSRMDRISAKPLYEEVSFTLFDYDNKGNLIKAEDYDKNGVLKYSISLVYDSMINPYYDQFKSVYLQRFIQLFYHSGYWASDVISSDEFLFPYLQNNIESVKDDLCNACYPEVIKRIYNYDDQSFVNTLSTSYWGAPASELTVEYFE